MYKPNNTVKALHINEIKARAVWYATHKGGRPRKPYTPTQRAALRGLEKAKAALVATTGAVNFKAAALKLNYTPLYAPRTTQTQTQA